MCQKLFAKGGKSKSAKEQKKTNPRHACMGQHSAGDEGTAGEKIHRTVNPMVAEDKDVSVIRDKVNGKICHSFL